MYKIYVFAPKTHSEEVKQAMFKAGAGRIGNYECCSFETAGVGQFKPLEGSDPYLGKTGDVEKVEEIKFEMICPEDKIKQVILAMREAHPYEEPAFDVIQLCDGGF